MIPSADAEAVADAIVSAGDVHEEILSESLREREESGRTICGGDMELEPVSSSFTSVSLPRCPRGGGGIIHGGGGHNIRSPRHSLQDMANVILGDAKASLVLGSAKSDLLLSPRESDLDDAQEAFREAIGVDASSPQEVGVAVDQRMTNSPPRARREARRRLSSLFRTVDTPVALGGPGSPESFAAAAVLPRDRARGIANALGVLGGQLFSFDLESANVNLAQSLLSEIAGALVLLLFVHFLGGRPSNMVASGP